MEREEHLRALQDGTLAEVEAAVAALLDGADASAVTDDVVEAVLDSVDREDVRRSAGTFELVLHFFGLAAEAGPAVVALLARAAEERAPQSSILREALAVLRANGQEDQLDALRERIATLPAEHPLRLAAEAT